MTREWINAGASNDWYNPANWAPPTGPGAWLPADIAQFKNSGTATSARINMSAGNLSLGAITTLPERARNLTIGNSSTVAGTGLLQLNGATVNGVDNVILSASTNVTSSYTLIIKNKLSAAFSPMEIVLGNAVDNIVLVNGEEGGAINISAPITGAGKKLTMGNTGASGGVLTLSGANTYTGITTVQARHGQMVLAKPGGGTLPAGNDVYILGGNLRIKTNQTLRNVKLGRGGSLLIDPGVKLTITETLEMGTIIDPLGGIKGTIVFA